MITENPILCKPNMGSCWCDAQTLTEEQLIEGNFSYRYRKCSSQFNQKLS